MLLYQDENRLNLLNIWLVLLWTESVVLPAPSLISTLAMSCSALNTCQPMLECSFQHWYCVSSCAHICWQWRDFSCRGAILLCFWSACNEDHSQDEFSSRSLWELNTAALMLLLCYAICLCLCDYLLPLPWGHSPEFKSYTECTALFYHKSCKSWYQQEENSIFHDTWLAGEYPAFLSVFVYFKLPVVCAFISFFCCQWPEGQTSGPGLDTNSEGLLFAISRREIHCYRASSI